MNKNPISKWLFSPVVGVLITLALVLLEESFPLKSMTNAPEYASWIDGIVLYWLYFGVYNGYFLVKALVRFFRSQSVKASDAH